MSRRFLGLAFALIALCLGVPTTASAQVSEEAWAPATSAELEAFRAVSEGKYIKGRELGEALLKRSPSSFVAHLVLAQAHHLGEANFPLSVYHSREALGLFEGRYGTEIGLDGPWRWHAVILRQLASAQQEVGSFEDALATIARYDQRYQPQLLALRAWPLMKLGRYEEARAAAREGMASGDPMQMRVALNSLCAIEFESGNDAASYDACKAAVERSIAMGTRPESVDLSNYAEAARSVFRLAESEKLLLQAVEIPEVSYGNPYRDLAELYLREGRFPEAIDALEGVARFRALRPPHMQNSDLNEDRRALSSLLLVAGRSDEAMRITSEALVLVDRRYHNSRDPAQDRAVAALLDRAALRSGADELREGSSAKPFYERWWAELRALALDLKAYRSGRLASRLLADRDRLVGTFRLGTAASGIMPPWLVGDLVEILGPGVVEAAISAASASDARESARAYYAAVRAEAALAGGDERQAIELSARAVSGLPRAEALLVARTEAVRAEAARRAGRADVAREAYSAALQRDPGVLRRLGLALPISLRVEGGALASEVARALGRSPRFDEVSSGLPLRVSGGEACLFGPSGERLGCGGVGDARGDERAQAIVDALHREVFAPRVELSQTDIHSLDGSNRGGGSDALDTLFQR